MWTPLTNVCSAVILVACVAGATWPAKVAFADEPTPTIELWGMIRDFPPESVHPDFLVTPIATPGERSARNVGLLLDDQKKPVYVGGGKHVAAEWTDAAGKKIAWCVPSLPSDTTGEFGEEDTAGIVSDATFAQWFRDVPGINMSRAWPITLTEESPGTFAFETTEFYPIDLQLLGNGPDEHNFYFTYEIACTFIAQPGQYVSFTGDDDCWIFVNNQLVIDHGGLSASRQQHFALDRLNLVAGEPAELRFFYAERFQPQSQFRIQTNIESLVSDTSLAALVACD